MAATTGTHTTLTPEHSEINIYFTEGPSDYTSALLDLEDRESGTWETSFFEKVGSRYIRICKNTSNNIGFDTIMWSSDGHTWNYYTVDVTRYTTFDFTEAAVWDDDNGIYLVSTSAIGAVAPYWGYVMELDLSGE